MEREFKSPRSELEKLKASNQELRARIEELQAQNAVLQASKQELHTVLARVARSETDQKNLLRSTQIATLFLDQQFHIRSFTPGLTGIYDLRPDDIGRPLSQTSHQAISMPPYPMEMASVRDWPIENEVETHDGRWYLRRVQPYMDYDDQRDGVVVTFYEITEQKKLRMRLAAAHAVTKLLADAQSFETVIPDVLKSLRISLEAAVCALWRHDEKKNLLTCVEIDADNISRQLFVETSYQLHLAIDEGLPGLVWKCRQPVWIVDIQNEERFLRSHAATVCKLTSGVATPIIVGNKFKGVIEIYTTRQLTREPELIEMLGSVGSEIGQFIRQRRLDLQFREEEARKAAILQSAIDCIITMDTQGRIVDFNPAAEQTFGFSAGDVVGQALAETIIPEHLRDAHREGFERFLRTGESKVLGKRIELTALRADGTQFPIELAISVSPAHGGEAFFTAYLRDITERKQSEAALIESKMRTELSLEVSDVALWNWDMQTNEVIPTPTLNRIFGFDENTRPRLAEFIDRIDASARDRIVTAIKHSMETSAVYDEEYPIHWPSGEIRHVRARGQVRKSDDGQVSDFFGVVVDITDRKRRELDIADREAHLRRVINNQLGLVGVIDRNGILLEVDDRSLEIARSRRADVIGKHFAETPWWNYDSDVVQQLRDAMNRAFAGEAVRFDVSLFAHGDEGVMIDFMIAPVYDNNGEVEYLIPSGVDIRERVKIEQEQRSTTRRMKMALRAGGLAAWEWTPTKSIWTPELYELLGIDPAQEANSELFFSLVHPEDVDDLKKSWLMAIEGADVYDTQFRIVRPDGQIRWINGLGEVVRDKAGKVACMYGVNWDSTQDHLQAEALRESERLAHAASASKSEFLANMSHEIRTPMTAILGYAELLSDSIDQEDAQHYLQTIRRNGNYLLEIINDILDLSKIEAGKLDVKSERFELYRLIEDVRSIMEVRAKEGGLALEVEYAGMLPNLILSDAKRLKQILINLVGNAIKFTRKGRVHLKVCFDPQTRQLQFDVTDTGIGISDEQMRGLFKPFSQGDASVSRKFGGTGLGLAISQRLAEMLGGKISASSTQGVGSTFTVNITVGETADSALVDFESMAVTDEAVELNSEAKPFQLACHVLIVDDRRDIRFLSKHIITRAGASVEECADGIAAVEYITACLRNGRCPDLVLLDMQMPKLDGYATAKRLRELGYTGPIIALTADAMQGDMSKCLDAGCNDYLSKPIDKDAMLQKIAAYCS